MTKAVFSFILLFLSIAGFSQNNTKTLPSVDVKNLQGETVNTADIQNDGPIIISFWATWCHPCVAELTAISDVYPDWQDETGVKLIAVSIDDSRNSSKVLPFVNGRNWDYEVLLDENGDLKRAMNVNNVPFTFLLDKDKKVVWEHNAYAPGDEDELYEKVKEYSGK